MRIPVDPILDKFLEGGIESDVITTIYGPAGSGKSCICMIIAKNIVKSGKKVIYIDTEGGFSVERFKQLDVDYEKTLNEIMLLKITNFKDQEDAFKNLNKTINDKVGMIIVDSIAMLYRYELSKADNVSDINKSLGLQLSNLIEIARVKNIPSVLTNQVYSDFDKPGEVKLIGGDILKYSSKCLIELKKAKTHRLAIIKKHRSIEENKELEFKIKNEGISPP